MPTYTVRVPANANDGGHLYSSSGNYSSARAGNGITAHTDQENGYIGQRFSGGVYSVWQEFLEFNTGAAIPAAVALTAAKLVVYGRMDLGATVHAVNVYQKAWGPSLTSADWLSPSGLSLLASLTFNTTESFQEFTENGTALRNAIAQGSGTTELVLASSRWASGQAPTSNEVTTIWGVNGGNTALHPYLDLSFDAEEASASPSTGSNITSEGQTSWSSPGNILTSNNQRATCARTSTGTSRILEASGFGFGLGPNDVVLGVKASIERMASADSAPNNVRDLTVGLRHNGSWLGDNRAGSGNWPTTEAAREYGGIADAWGATLTPAIVNDPTFGLGLTVTINRSSGTVTASVDYMALTIYYLEGPSPVVQAATHYARLRG